MFWFVGDPDIFDIATPEAFLPPPEIPPRAAPIQKWVPAARGFNLGSGELRTGLTVVE